MISIDGVLVDLLMGVMDSLAVWSKAAGDREQGLRWRDAATGRMVAAPRYIPYDNVVREAATEVGLPSRAADALFRHWSAMEPWPDAAILSRATLPYAFVTNCSTALAAAAADRSGLRPRFVLSAEAAGRYKPDPAIYAQACRYLGALPPRTAFIAGSTYDALGAAGAGLQTWLVRRRPNQAVPAGVSVVGSLAGLADLLSGEGARGEGEDARTGW